MVAPAALLRSYLRLGSWRGRRVNQNLHDRAHSDAPTPPVAALLHHLNDVRQTRNNDSTRRLQDLTPHLHAARAVERELDR